VCNRNLSRFTSKIVSLAKKAVGGNGEPSVQKGDGGYADWVMVGLHGLRDYLGHPYRRLMDILKEMPGIVAKFELKVAELPDVTTVCTRKQRLEMRILRVLLRLAAELQAPSKIHASDATGFDRIAASHHYANRTNYSFRSVRTPVIVDCSTSQTLYIHCSMKQPHDTLIGCQVPKRNLDRVETLTADKGYDRDEFPRYLHEKGVRPIIKHRELPP
jgi:IS5 family transposase